MTKFQFYRYAFYWFIILVFSNTNGNAQCVSGGMWQNFTPTCSGSAQLITPAGYAGEYDAVNLTAGNYYKFDSSVPTDVVTITDNANSILAWGVATVIFKPTVSGLYRFYDHTPLCGSQFVNRSRYITCNASPQPCITSPFGQYPANTFTPTCTAGDQVITTAAYAGDYSVVSLVQYQTVTFKSSIASDIITITNGNASIIFVCGLGQVSFTAPYNGTFRFYTHLSGCGTVAVGRYRSVVVSPTVTPSLTISTTSNSICSGSAVTFTATPTNGGWLPSYQWKVDGVIVGTNSNTFTSSTLTDGCKVTCTMAPNNFCQTTNSVNSNVIVMTVATPVVPSVSITASETSICSGSSITFNATPVNGGFFPSYQWKVDGVNVGANSSTFSSSTLTNGNVITCVLTASNSCQNPASVTSNPITISVFPYVTPAVTITASGNSICSGVPVTFTANTVNGGLYPDIKWYVNGFLTQFAPTTTFTTTSLANNDIVTCGINAYENCLTSFTATSNAISMNIKSSPTVSISGNNCTGSVLTSTSDSLSTTSISWYLNQSLISQPIASYQPQPNAAGSKSIGNGLNQFSDPYGLAVDASGALYIADRNNDRVMKYNPGATSGIIVAGNGTAGSGLNQLNHPSNIFIDVHDNLYVLDDLNNRVMKYTPGATSGTIVAGGNGFGNAANQIYGANDIFVTSNGDVYVAEYAKVSKWAPGATTGVLAVGTGNYGHTSTQIGGVNSIFINTAGDIYLTDGDGSVAGTSVARIVKFPAGSNVCTTIAGGMISGTSNNQFNYPNDISLDANGDLIVFDYLNNRIVKWPAGASSGTTIVSNSGICNIPGGWCAARHMFFDPKTNNIFMSTFNEDVKKWSLIVPYTLTASTPGNYSITVTNNIGCSASASLVVNDPVTPTVHITGNTNQICAGVSNTLTAQTTNLGTLTNYYWYVNNNLMFNNSPIFTLSSLQNGDKVKLTVLTYSNCQTTNTTSDSVIVSVYPIVIPTAALTCINPCPGAPTQFNLTATNTGSSPTYSWFVNNVNQSNNTTSLTLPNPQNGDVVYCTVNSSQVCALPSSVTSNSIAIVPYVTPTLALSSVDNQSCFGDTIHFVASGTNGGFSPSYQWSVNGLPISNTGTTFKSASLSNESLVRCVMTSNANCLTNSTASSNIIPALVNYCNGISLRMLIQGFYIGNHKMSPVLYNNGLSSNPHDVDTITVALHDQFDPSVKVFEKQTILKDSGYANVFFENLPYNESYYISVKHRNSIETWSNSPITMKNDVRFSFSTDQYRGVKDIDGNVYDTISIGTQVWFKSNLNTSKYRDGAVIQNASLASDWTIACQTNKGAWCYYNNDSTGSFVNGKLYNWYAVNDTALCPVGWHVPTTNDWTILANYLGGTSVAGGKLKETGLSHFININTGATNSSGFTGLPSGFRIMSFPNIVFAEKFNIGQFWESNTKAYNSIQSYNTSLTRFGTAVSNYMGTSVRCVKD